MATYNWTYQPGRYNPYGITINSGANDVMPSNACYVALWGNDTTGNGSRMFPYRTIKYAIPHAPMYGYIIIGNGVYREALGVNDLFAQTIVGDGDVKIDGYTLGTGLYTNNLLGAYNIKFYNLLVKQFSGQTGDCTFYNVTISQGSSGGLYNCTFTSCIFGGTLPWNNCTFYKSYVPFTNVNLNSNQNNIFHTCNLDFIVPATTNFAIDFILLYQCNVRFNASTSSQSTVFYPNPAPTGYTYASSISGFRTALAAYFTSQTVFAQYTQVTDPLFNNLLYLDYSLSFNSPPKNMSYQGGYIGAKSIAYGLNPKANAATSDFENDTAVNLNIADNSITLTDTTQIGSIITKPIVNPSARELARFAVYGVNADRNGQYVDATSDQATVTLNAGNALNAGTPYSVEVGAITYNGTVYQPGDNFTSLETNPGTFTTSAGGVVRETTEAAARENVQVRFNDGTNPQISVGTALEALGRYYVVSGSITYNGTTYNAGQVFKADNTGTNTFTGTGAIQLIFHDNDVWYYFELGTKPQSNNSGNTRTGAITLGNGDPNFDRTAANVFNINQKFMQLKYTIQVNNLTP